MGKCCLRASSFILDWLNIKVAGNQDRHKSLVQFDFRRNQTSHFGVTCPWVTEISHIWTWISLKPVSQSWSDFICSIIWVEERPLHVLGQIESKLWCPWQQKAPIDLWWRKWCLHLFLVAFDQILFILTGNEDMHKILDEFRILARSDHWLRS